MPKPGVFKSINPSDINITPFKVYKRWHTNQTDYSSSLNIQILKGVFAPKIIPVTGSLVTELTNPDDSIQKVIYYSIDHLFYKRKEQPYEQFGNTDLRYIDKFLFDSCSIVSIPQRIIGEGIREQSIQIKENSVTSSQQMTIRDDGKGNLYDTLINTGSMVPFENMVGYWGFNEHYRYKTRLGTYPKVSHGTTEDRSISKAHLKFRNVYYTPGIKTTGYSVQTSGIRASLRGDGYLYHESLDSINFKQDQNFAISLWVNIPNTQLSGQDSTQTYIISKQGEYFRDQYNPQTGLLSQSLVPFNEIKFPYSIRMYNQTSALHGKLYVSRNDGYVEPFLTSSMRITGSDNHIVFQKSQSYLQLYINGTLNGQVTDTCTLNTHNNSHLFVGTKGFSGSKLSGSIDELRMFNTCLTQAQISSLRNNNYLSGSAYNTSRIGNVFYKHGIMVFSSPMPKYKNIMTGRTGAFNYTGSHYGFDMTFKGSHTIYENEYVCKIRDDEFNMTLNPTARRYNSKNEELYKPFVSHSDFTPYITTVGLYDDFGRLLAIGKLAQPIPKRSDIETTFIIRYDT